MVAFPEGSLAPGEKVKLHIHPHWTVIVFPAILSLVVLGGGAIAVIFLMMNAGIAVAGAIGLLALVLFLWLGVSPWLRWRSTHYVVTEKHVLIKEGVFHRYERSIPLAKVTDVKTNQSPVERLLGSGTLTLESAGDHSHERLPRVPEIRKAAREVKGLAHQPDRGV